MSWNICKSLQLLLVTFSTLAVVPVSLGQLAEANNNVYESWGTTSFKETKFRYTWTITQYGFCCKDAGDQVESPTFSGLSENSCQLRMRLYPKADRNVANVDHVSLYLNSVSCNNSLEYQFGILNDENKEIAVKNYTSQFEQGKSVGDGKFVPQSFLLDKENHLLKDNKLIVFCEITERMQTSSGSNIIDPPKHRIEDDIASLLEDYSFSDVTLSAQGKEFRVHRGILAARSPVFKSMFMEAQDKENNSLIEITNVDHKVLNEMLRYIYTEKVSNVDKIARSLLAASDNYKLNDLKLLCENSLSSNLSSENAIDLLILSDQYHAENLKKQAREFILAHAADTENSSGFESLLLSNPRLALETFNSVG